MAPSHEMHFRRRHAILPLAVVGALALLASALVAYRYLAYRRILAKLGEAAAAIERLPDPALRRDLKAHVAYLDARLRKLRRRDVLLGRRDREASELHRACLGKTHAPHLRPGHHVIVTVSALDGAELPTSVAVPEGWDGSSPLPLVLDLHAAGVREMADCFPVEGHPGALCVTPLARGSHDYMGAQMAAVEECLGDVRRRYPVSRLVVVGASMGGLGAWLFAQRHVAEVSGLAPWMANADPEAWRGVWEDDEDRHDRSPAGRACAMAQLARMPVARVGQLAGRHDLPIYIGHGAADTIVPVGHSDSMADKLRALGATSLRYDRFQGLGHGGFPVSRAERLAWLFAHAPAEPTELTAVVPPLTFVADLAGAPPHRVLDPLKEATLTIRGGRIVAGVNAEPATDATPSKWHYPGPAGFAFDHPFSIALPASAPPHLADCAEELAEAWTARWGGTVRRSDAAVGFAAFPPEAAGRPRTLIAPGSPAENPAVAAALGGLDVAIATREARLFGRTFRGDDIGLIILRPDTADPRAATVVVWGSTPQSYMQLWARFGHVVHLEGDRGRWYFDYALFDRKTCGPDSFLAVGYFDHDWRFDPRLLFEGSAELRAKIPGSHWPMTNGPCGQQGRVWLSSLPPESIEARRGPVAFDRSAGVDAGPLMAQGEHFERGIGMVPPATVRWRLGRRFATFRARVGLQHTGAKYPLRHQAERVQFEVWADGRCVAASPVLSATDGLADLTADIRGADRIELRAIPTTKFLWHFGPVAWADPEVHR